MPHLDPENWQLISSQLDRALELSDAEREPWLNALERAEPQVARRLRELLAARANLASEDFLERGTAARYAPAVSSMRGRRVGAYVIEAEIGRGGMGSVWRASRADGQFSGVVAVKFLHPAAAGSESEQRFRSEGNLLARLSHPNIARLLDAGMADGQQPYLVLEYVEGEPIDAYCKRRELDLEARIRLLLNVCSAVSHAHSHLIVHRDLKPSNILVRPDGVVKLLDFGIAKLIEEGGAPGLTRADVQVLTPEYAAPEQLLGQPITTATDVYALGLVAFLLLTGRHPLSKPGEAHADWVRGVLDRDPPRASLATEGPATLRRRLQGDLDNILGKALRKAPQERYPSVEAFADDLARFLDHEPVLAAPTTITYRVGKFVQRHRGSVLVATLTAVALIASTIITASQMREARLQRDIAQTELKRADAFNDVFSILLVAAAADASHPLTADALLARAERLVNAQFVADPLLRSQLLYSLARLHSQSGQTGEQRRLYGAALTAAREAGEPRSTALAGCAVAATDAVTGDIPGATKRIDEILGHLPATARYDDIRADCWRYRSTVSTFAGDGVRALADAQRAEALAPDDGGGSEWGRLSAALMLANAERHAGQFTRADATFQQVSDAFERLGLADTAFNAVLLNNWAIDLTALGQPMRAAGLIERVMEIDRAGGDTDAFASTVYANILLQLERPVEALAVLEPALQGAVRNGNRNSANMVRMGLAGAYRETGDLARAAAMLDAAQREISAMLPPGHEAFGGLHSSRAQIAYRRHDLAAALVEVDEAIRIFAARPGLVEREATARELKSRILLDLGRFDDALREAQQGRKAFDELLGPDVKSSHLGTAWLTIARIRAARGEASGAAEAARSALQHLSATLPPTHSKRVEALRLAPQLM